MAYRQAMEKRKMQEPVNTKRYEILLFPSLHGTPWRTEGKWRAWALFVVRCITDPVSEIRLVDNTTGDHIAVR